MARSTASLLRAWVDDPTAARLDALRARVPPDPDAEPAATWMVLCVWRDMLTTRAAEVARAAVSEGARALLARHPGVGSVAWLQAWPDEVEDGGAHGACRDGAWVDGDWRAAGDDPVVDGLLAVIAPLDDVTLTAAFGEDQRVTVDRDGRITREGARGVEE